MFDNGPEGGWGHKKVKDYWKEISPAHNLSEKTPPTIIFLGTEDKLIPVETAERYQERLKKSGVKCELKLYPKQGHGFFNQGRKGSAYEDTVKEMVLFLKELGHL